MKPLKIAFGVFGVCFLFGPMLFILPLAFNGGSFLIYPLESVSLRWFRMLYTDPGWRLSIVNSFIIGLASAMLATVLGTAAAIGLRRRSGGMVSLTKTLFILPIATPVVVLGVGMQLVYGKLGLNSSYTGMIIGHAVLAIPFVMLSVLSALSSMNERVEWAAASLGARPIKVMWLITLPITMPGIVTGFAFAFANSLDEVVLTLFLAGPNQRTVARQMFYQLRDNLNPAIAAAAFTYIVATICIGGLALWLQRRKSLRLGTSA